MKLLVFNPEKVVFYKFAVVGGMLLALLIGCYRFTLTPLDPPDSNSFDDGDQGWRVSAGGVGSYSATGGYPGGYMAGLDNTDGTWYFIAPTPFTNEVRKGYGRTLRFDQFQSATDAQGNTDDIILTDGRNTLTFNTSYNPNTTWTSYAIKLDELSGWEKGKQRATKADMQAVLRNLTGLRIRGEFRSGPDYGGLDNVAIY